MIRRLPRAGTPAAANAAVSSSRMPAGPLPNLPAPGSPTEKRARLPSINPAAKPHAPSPTISSSPNSSPSYSTAPRKRQRSHPSIFPSAPQCSQRSRHLHQVHRAYTLHMDTVQESQRFSTLSRLAQLPGDRPLEPKRIMGSSIIWRASSNLSESLDSSNTIPKCLRRSQSLYANNA